MYPFPAFELGVCLSCVDFGVSLISCFFFFFTQEHGACGPSCSSFYLPLLCIYYFMKNQVKVAKSDLTQHEVNIT